MLRRHVSALALTAILAWTYACEQGGHVTPVTPSGTNSSIAQPAFTDQVTLKTSAPTVASPADGTRTTSRTPTLSVVNAVGSFVPLDQVAATYHFRVYNPAGNVVAEAVAVPQGSDGTTNWDFPVLLQFATPYTWSSRVEIGTRVGPPTQVVSFVTPDPPPPPSPAATPPPPPTGEIGPNRSFGVNEVVRIVKLHHDVTRPNLGPSSTRASRVAWWHTAMRAVIFGHAQYNPQGGDPGWCVKNNGPGRPLNDDVAVRCGNRDAWDLVGGIGAVGYTFRAEFIGTLPSNQGVFHP